MSQLCDACKVKPPMPLARERRQDHPGWGNHLCGQCAYGSESYRAFSATLNAADTPEKFKAVATLAAALDEKEKGLARWAYAYHRGQLRDLQELQEKRKTLVEREKGFNPMAGPLP